MLWGFHALSLFAQSHAGHSKSFWRRELRQRYATLAASLDLDDDDELDAHKLAARINARKDDPIKPAFRTTTAVVLRISRSATLYPKLEEPSGITACCSFEYRTRAGAPWEGLVRMCSTAYDGEADAKYIMLLDPAGTLCRVCTQFTGQPDYEQPCRTTGRARPTLQQRADRRKAAERRRKAKGTAAQMHSKCTKCKKSFKTKQGLAIHNGRAHKKKLK